MLCVDVLDIEYSSNINLLKIQCSLQNQKTYSLEKTQPGGGKRIKALAVFQHKHTDLHNITHNLHHTIKHNQNLHSLLTDITKQKKNPLSYGLIMQTWLLLSQ